LRPPASQRREHRGEPLGIKQTIGHMPRDKRIELVHGYGPTLTRDLPVSGTGRTAVIAVNLARLRSAGTQSHGATARYAKGKTREQYGTAYHPWWCYPGIAALEQVLDSLKYVPIYNDRHLRKDLIRLRFSSPSPCFDPIEWHPARVDGMGQHLMYRPEPPSRAGPSSVTTLVEPNCDRLYALRS
jgi:hypothetical protein